MQDLIAQEQFELEVLERLNSARLLDRLIFGGGTMLRLCYGLNRFSVDLDFWTVEAIEAKKFFGDVQKCLTQDYTLKDAADKFNTLLFEIRSTRYPRSLKIEIRKEKKNVAVEEAIAYSPYAGVQVRLKTVSLKDCMSAKVQAFLERREVRDAFDMEFLLKKGVTLDVSVAIAKKILNVIDGLSVKDYTVKLGSLLKEEERKYYTKENFKILKMALRGADHVSIL